MSLRLRLPVSWQRHGRDVSMAVPPNLVRFAESAGLCPVNSYGPDSQRQLEAEVFQDWFKLRSLCIGADQPV